MTFAVDTNFFLAAAFITPMFAAAGAALIGIPILIHILNRRRFKVVQWAAMEYLLQAMRKNRRRLKFEQWVLLAVRCLVLLFLGLALARPLACQENTIASIVSQRTGLHVIVIDNSYSMSYEAARPDALTHLDQAKRMATELMDGLAAGGESVAVVLASRPSSLAFPEPIYNLQAAKDAIRRIAPSAGGTDLAGALQRALEIGRGETKQSTKHLHLFTDATRSAWESPDAQSIKQLGPELAQVFRLTHFNLGKQNQWNQAVVNLSPTSSLVTTKFGSDFSAIVRGFGEGPESLLQWRLDDMVLPGSAQIRLAPDTPPQTQSQAVLKTGGPHLVSVTLASDDRLKIDNTRSHVVDVASELKVLIVEGERGMGDRAGSGTFLQLALAPPREAGKPESYISPEVISDLELGNKVLTDYSAVVLADVGQVQPRQAEQLAGYVQGGGTLLLFMGNAVQADNYNTSLLPRKLMPGPLINRIESPADGQGFHFAFQPNAGLHPLLKEFANQEKTGLDTAQIFTYWQVEVPADSSVERVLDYVAPAGKDKKDPAVTVHTLGQGRVVFYSTTVSPEWTTFPANPSYVTLMHELLGGTVKSRDRWLNVNVGEGLEIPRTVRLTGLPQLLDPNRKPLRLDVPSDGQVAYRSERLDRPGVYSVVLGDTTLPVAVNVPSDEADVRTIPDAAVRAALGDVEINLLADELPAQGESAQAGSDMGWSFMLMVLLLAGTECLMAIRFGHYKRMSNKK